MGAAINDVHHGHRHGGPGAQVPIDRDAFARGRRVGRCQGHSEQSVGAQPLFVGGPVQLQQTLIDGRLIFGIAPCQCSLDLAVDMAHSARHALTQIPATITVAQLDGLASARGSSGWDSGATAHTAGKNHVRFHRRVTPRVENLTSSQVDYFIHASLPNRLLPAGHVPPVARFSPPGPAVAGHPTIPAAPVTATRWGRLRGPSRATDALP